MICEYNLTEEGISGLISFLSLGDGLQPSSIGIPASPAELRSMQVLSNKQDEFRPQVEVFGDNYEDVVKNARGHVKGCESCNRFYREELLNIAGMIDISKRKSEGSDDAGSLEEDLRDLDGEWLGILYDD